LIIQGKIMFRFLYINLGIRRLVWAWQRVYRGWDDSAIWSIDSYLVEMLPEMIDKLRDAKKGYPGSMLTDDLKHLSGSDLDEACFNKWVNILNQIANGFRAAEKILDGGGPAWDEYFNEYHKLYGDNLSRCSTEDMSKRDEIWERLNMDERLKLEQDQLYEEYNNGMDLFKEYFFNLWW
jgi:hypothetical protein